MAATQIAALLYALRNVFYAAASYPVGRIGRPLQPSRTAVLGYRLGAVVMVGFIMAFLANTSSILCLGVLFALAGVYIAAEDSLEGEWLPTWCPTSRTAARPTA